MLCVGSEGSPGVMSQCGLQPDSCVSGSIDQSVG